MVARLECSLQPDEGGTTSTGMRQEVDIRYVVTSLKGSAQHLYENVYCQRGQMENLIKLHKVQLASQRTSCHSATTNQVRLAPHTAAFWLIHAVRSSIRREIRSPRPSSPRSGRGSSSSARASLNTSHVSASTCQRAAQRGLCSVASHSD